MRRRQHRPRIQEAREEKPHGGLLIPPIYNRPRDTLLLTRDEARRIAVNVAKAGAIAEVKNKWPPSNEPSLYTTTLVSLSCISLLFVIACPNGGDRDDRDRSQGGISLDLVGGCVAVHNWQLNVH